MVDPDHIRERYRVGDLSVDAKSRRVSRNGRTIRLPELSFDLLLALIRATPAVVSLDQLMDRVWPGRVVNQETVSKRVTLLRAALGDDSHEPRYIALVRGCGYRLLAPVTAIADTGEAEAEAAGPRRTWAFAGFLAIALVATFMLTGRGVNHGIDAPIRSIAVLPFRDLSEDGQRDYFAAGMTEALITRLAQNPSLRVVSRRATARYQDGEETIAAIARDLQVDGVIDSSIVRQGNDLRVDVQLIRAADESHAWAQSYERSIQDIFLLQHELADDISSEISAGIDSQPNSRVSEARSDNIEAYELYLQGQHLWNQRNRQSVSKSLEYFQKAIDLDSGFAAAYAGLARAYATLGGQTLVKSMSPEDVRPAAMAAASRAVELDAGLSEAHWAMATVLSHLLPQNKQTDLEIEQEYLLALRLNPASAGARHGYANFLSNRHRSSEAIEQFREALLLDPLSPNYMGRLGMELVDNGQVEEGMKLMQKAVDIEPWQFNAHLRLGWTYAALEQYDEANKALAVAEQVSPGNPQALAIRSYVAARSGEVAKATEALTELQAWAEAIDAPFLVAIVYVGLQQDRDRSLEWLERAASSQNNLRRDGLYGLNSPIYDWLRDDPRFERIRQLVEGPESRPD
jgi:TolB-like protein/DNA-binding winged helix-turn-helix (wHTH) protein